MIYRLYLLGLIKNKFTNKVRTALVNSLDINIIMTKTVYAIHSIYYSRSTHYPKTGPIKKKVFSKICFE